MAYFFKFETGTAPTRCVGDCEMTQSECSDSIDRNFTSSLSKAASLRWVDPEHDKGNCDY